LRHPLAGYLLLSGIGTGPSPDGVHKRNRPANLRTAWSHRWMRRQPAWRP